MVELELRKRIKTSVILSFFFLLIIILSSQLIPFYYFSLLVYFVIFIIALDELSFVINSKERFNQLYWLNIFSTSIPILSIIFYSLFYWQFINISNLDINFYLKWFITSIFSLLLLLLFFGRNNIEFIKAKGTEIIFGHLLVGLCSLSIIYLLSHQALFIYLIATVCTNDIVAYFCGKKFGRSKLCPAISPGKTIEGSVSGLFFGTFTGVIIIQIYNLYALTHLSLYDSFFLSTGTVLFGQVGDLIKSYIKRVNDVKDFGSLLPGHGGVIDRLDGILLGSLFLSLFS